MGKAVPDYALTPEFATLHTVSWTTYGISTAIQFGVGILMWRRLKASSVKIAIASLWFCGLVLSVAGHFTALALIDADFAASDLKSFIVPIVSITVWTAYLLRSVRVKNTYDFHGLKA
jgi:Protein of unknown function (DUF2569)